MVHAFKGNSTLQNLEEPPGNTAYASWSDNRAWDFQLGAEDL